MWGSLQGSDERITLPVTFQPPEFFGGDDDNLIATMNRDMLRSFAVNAAHEFAEASLCVLQQPLPPRAYDATGLRLGWRDWWLFCFSGHAD